MIHAGRDIGYKHISNRKAHKDGAQYGLQLAGEAGGPGPPIWNYSGTGIYHKTIHVPAEWLGPDQGVFLDLGEVRELAEIFNNGKSAGVLWKPPFRVDATALVRPGANELKTEVMNLWINRLVGDQPLPPEERLTRTNIRQGEGWEIQPAGLLGPVRLPPSRDFTIR